MKRILLLFLLVFSIWNGFGQVTMAKFQFESNLAVDAGAIGSPAVSASATFSYFGGVTGNAASFANAGGKYLDLVISTTGYSNILISFSGRSSAASTSWVVTGDSSGGTTFSAVTSLACPNGSFGSLTETNLGAIYNNKSSIRLRITATGSTATLRLDDLVIKGTETPTGPTVTVTPSTLSGFTYAFGNGPSAFQTFNVSGSGLTGDLTVTPATNYEISKTDASYSSTPLVFSSSVGNVASSPVYVKLKAGLAVGNYNGETISVTAAGATSKTVTVDGSVTALTPKMNLKGNALTISNGRTTVLTTDGTDFGSTAINNTITKTFTIENTGNAALVLSSPAAIFSNTTSPFSFSAPLASTIAPGSSTTFTVSFNSTTAATFDNNVLVGSNDGNVSSTYSFAVKGIATDIPANPTGTISGTTPACTSATLTYTGTIPADQTYYWQTTALGTSTANNASSTLTAATTGNYYVRAYKGGSWSVASTAAYALVVNTPITITTQPSTAAASTCQGTAFSSISVAVSGTSPTYQWYKSNDNSNNTTGDDVLVGSNSSSFTPPNATVGTAYYYVIVSGAAPCTSTKSNISGAINVIAKPATPQGTITPASSCGTTNLTYNFGTGENTDGNTYYWQTSATETAVTNPVASTVMTQTTNGTRYIRSQNASGCWSDAISRAIVIYTTPIISTQPTNQTAAVGDNATFNVNGASFTNYNRQWQVSTDGGLNWNNIGTSGSSLTVTSVTLSQHLNRYKVIVTNGSCVVESNVVTLTVNNAGPNNASALKSCLGETEVTLNWTVSSSAEATGYMVFVQPNTTVPQMIASSAGNASNYTINSDYSLATSYTTLGKAVYRGSANTATITGLTNASQYTFKVVAYTGETQTGWATGINIPGTYNQTYTINTPDVTNFAASTAPTSSSISWNVVPDSAGCYQYIVVANQGPVTLIPTGDGSAYTANTIYSGGNQMIYKGTGNSASISSLTENVEYCYKVFVKKGNQWSDGLSVCKVTGLSYCDSYSATDTYTAGIKRVKFNTIDKTSTVAENVTYTNNTAISNTAVEIGHSYNLMVTVNSNGPVEVYTRAWIDWNRNGTFDSNEVYDLGTAGNSASNVDLPTYLINVPVGASLGFTRMRITTKYKSGDTYATPCEQGLFSGEVEDYTIQIVRPAGSEIVIKGLAQNISSGSTTTSSFNNTLYGATALGATLEKQYAIENIGLSTLLLNGTPSISLGGANPADFTITQYPTTAITSGSTTNFKIAFSPLYTGLRTAVVSIANNDETGNENPFTFLIQGSGNCATIPITITPLSGPVGTEVTIKATSGNLTGASISFNGIVATAVTPVSSTEVRVIVPAGATTGTLNLTNAQGCNASNNFTIIDRLSTSCEGTTVLPTELYISEVTDHGTGGHSFIEIFNGTGAPISLTNYSLRVYNNGATTTSSTINLTGTINNNNTYVVAIGGNPDADEAHGTHTANLISHSSGINGDDNIRLFNGAVHIDQWGDMANVQFTVAEKDYYYRRKNTGITVPSTTWNASDWSAATPVDYSDVGNYNFSIGITPTITLQPIFSDKCGTTSFAIVATEGFATGIPLAYQWFMAAPGATSWTEIANDALYNGATTSSLLISSLVGLDHYQFYAQVRENTATCFTASHAVVVLGSQGTVIWDGSSWSGGLPDNTKDIIIDGFFNTAVNGHFEARSLTNNGTIAITDGEYIKVEYGITNNGSLTITNNASLVQVCDNAVNGGTQNVIMKRDAKPMYRYDYTYWSTPITPQTFGGFSPNTLADKYFKWNSQLQDWVNVLRTDSFEKGHGYIIRAPQSYTVNPIGAREIFTGIFTGVLNNGIITVPVVGGTQGQKLNLLGNPYPSAIYADSFLDNTINPDLDGTIYVWTHNTPLNPVPNEFGFYSYADNDYAVYNAVGGTSTDPSAVVYNGHIAAGQAFFVKGKADGIATFNNSMRETNHNNQFLRNSNTNEKSRIWLNIADSRNAFKQTLIGYLNGASNSLDRNFDGELMGGNTAMIYSIVSQKNLAIQGRSLPFLENDIVDLGYKITTAGTFKISLANFDGLFENQNIYLEDKTLNVIHDLKQSDYEFTSAVGTFNTRFVLRYNSAVLSNPDHDLIANNVSVATSGKTIIVKSSLENIQKITVYDLLGRSVYENKKVNNTQFAIQDVVANQQALVVKIYLENEQQVSKKVIVN